MVYYIISHKKAKCKRNRNARKKCVNRHIARKLVLIEHEYMGPNLTPAEGFILGVGAKMFTIAGPVIVYGVLVSVI